MRLFPDMLFCSIAQFHFKHSSQEIFFEKRNEISYEISVFISGLEDFLFLRNEFLRKNWINYCEIKILIVKFYFRFRLYIC